MPLWTIDNLETKKPEHILVVRLTLQSSIDAPGALGAI